MKEVEESSLDTRERLLQAAGEVFAQSGYRNATVREISRRAKANIAAVNYHFGDKGRLYSAVMKVAYSSAMQKYPPNGGLGEDAEPEDRLAAFVRSFLHRILDEGRPAWHGKLLAKEIADPTPILDQLIDEMVRPTYEALIAIIRAILGKTEEDQQVRLCAGSIVGQCLHYYHAQPVIARVFPIEVGPGAIDRLAEHITCFSLSAMKCLRKKGDAR